MALLIFPSNPANGTLYPSAPVVDQNQYKWVSVDNTWRLLGAATGVTPGIYCAGDVFAPKITVDAVGRITDVECVELTGFIKTNNTSAYNDYVWPSGNGLSGQFLVDDGTGLLTWSYGAFGEEPGLGLVVDGTALKISVPITSTAPVVGTGVNQATQGSLYWDPLCKDLYIYYDDGVTPDWFPATTYTNKEYVRLNNSSAFNSYVWPNADGLPGQVLSTNGGGFLSWETVSVTVQPQPAPASPVDGNLWFDCSTGKLFVYQSCIGTPGWYDVSQGGLPVDPINVSAVPSFLGGDGTIGNPYQCTATSTTSGGTEVIVNTVTVTGLAPNQFVPINDLNAFTNQGRFSFTNNYADGGGTLMFQIIFRDVPPSSGGTTFNALIRVGNATAYISSEVNVSSFILTPGSIAGTPTSGSTLTYTQGVASGGVAPYAYTWVWRRDGVNISGATASTYTLTSADAGKNITVRLTATDATAAAASATTSSVGPVAAVPFPPGVWSPTPAGAMNTSNPGTSSGVWNGTTDTITATGCVEVSTDGSSWSNSLTINPGNTLYQRWKQTSLCGGAATGTTITGTVAATTYSTNYSLTINRVPSPSIADISSTNVNPSAVTTQQIASPIFGLNSTAYVTYAPSSTGLSIQASTDNISFVSLTTSGTGFSVVNGQTLYIRQTTGSAITTPYTAVIRVGDGTNTLATYDEFVYTATTTSTPPFPGLPPSLQAGPTTIPGTVSGTWASGTTTLTATGCILISSDNVTFNQGPLVINDGDTLYEKWEPTGASCGEAPDATTITGTITNGTEVQSYSLTIDRTPATFNLTTLTGQTLSSTVTSNTVTLSGTNAATYITYTAGSPNTLVNPQVSINSGAYVAVPSSGTTLSAPPGATLTFQADVGSALNTQYTISFNLGSLTRSWSVTTKATLDPGEPYAGGYYGGQLDFGGTLYNLVIAPVTEGSLQGQTTGLSWATVNTNDTSANVTFYGSLATTTYANAQHPVFNWAVNNVNGPNAGTYDATNTAGTGIGGYNDWYVPARYELMILYYYFKVGTAPNDFGTGNNPYAEPPVISPFTTFDPPGDSIPGFTQGETQAFLASQYATATQVDSTTFEAMNFVIGTVDNLPKIGPTLAVRAIRRVPA